MLILKMTLDIPLRKPLVSPFGTWAARQPFQQLHSPEFVSGNVEFWLDSIASSLRLAIAGCDLAISGSDFDTTPADDASASPF